MQTDDFWRYDDDAAYSPWGPFDCTDGGARLAFTFDASDWLASAGTNLTLDQAQTTIFQPPGQTGLLMSALGFNGAQISVVISIDPAHVPTVGQFVRFTVRPWASDGQHDDRSYWLRMSDR